MDFVIDGGLGTLQPSTVIEWLDAHLQVLREGAGDIGFLQD